MAESTALLPSLEWVRVFEAAARLGSFTAAARELGLTQAAVSQRIRHLEERLGVSLFERQARGVTLSLQGEAWLPHVQQALERLTHSADSLFAAPRTRLSLMASVSLIELWIVPRLAELQAVLPRRQLLLSTMHRWPDYAQAEADLDIRFGEGDWPERDSQRLFGEVLAPMATPALLATVPDWRQLPRIAVAGPRLGWREWDQQCEEAPGPMPVVRLDSLVQALRAAEAGAGVLLGSLPLCASALASGRLHRASQETLPMAEGYWLTRCLDRPAGREFEQVLAALRHEG
ncbi:MULTISPECIES: LysR family transcriptional regulator [Halomonadaceae]|uniref:LysR family transcriptional regulator n=1 Tax=Halomonadaceae TaxID=28256 RepID=UPI00158383EB|nr:MULTISPECIES: LysR family transcriptional regulator [Halomonas]MDI4638495.1 LysR family transcriptional regulator [Halomonas sp. BMC7]NUJ59481.1 LysR family transcriptional regulator [Halomonas taeanensis]